jgi:hypothetical protein
MSAWRPTASNQEPVTQLLSPLAAQLCRLTDTSVPNLKAVELLRPKGQFLGTTVPLTYSTPEITEQLPPRLSREVGPGYTAHSNKGKERVGSTCDAKITAWLSQAADGRVQSRVLSQY